MRKLEGTRPDLRRGGGRGGREGRSGCRTSRFFYKRPKRLELEPLDVTNGDNGYRIKIEKERGALSTACVIRGTAQVDKTHNEKTALRANGAGPFE